MASCRRSRLTSRSRGGPSRPGAGVCPHPNLAPSGRWDSNPRHLAWEAASTLPVRVRASRNRGAELVRAVNRRETRLVLARGSVPGAFQGTREVASGYIRYMGRLALSGSTVAVCIALGGILSAHGAIGASSYHGPGKRGFSDFAINPRNPQIVYAGTGSGVFKSIDGGGRWRAVNVGLTEPYVFDLAVDQRHPATLYAATGSSVFKSTNAGRTWRATSRPSISAIALALHPRNARVLYAGTDEGVYKSSDAGASWRKVTTHPHAVRVYTIALDPQQPATVYAGSGGGVFKSTDAGRSWEKRNLGLMPNETANGNELAEGTVNAIVVDSRRPQTLYVGSRRGGFKSTDGARRWRRMNAAGSFRHVDSLAIDPRNPQTLYAGTRALLKTTNGGRRWNAIGTPVGGTMLALAVDPTNSKTVYVGIGAKAYKSMDGGRTWSALSIPVP